MNAMIAVLGGVLGGVCLFFFGWMMIVIFVPILLWARDHKHGKDTPLDIYQMLDWEREYNEEIERDMRDPK